LTNLTFNLNESVIFIIWHVSFFIAFYLDEKSPYTEQISSNLNDFNLYLTLLYGFDSLFTQFPGGYATPLGEEGINISGGQRQLIALARALLQKPKVLILDEATSSLDKQTESFVLTLLKRLSRKSIIIFISHREQSLSKITNKIYRFM
jgi:ABC-type bacteriocin/lantibiotic exporter with double-glycine peptidase domain